MADTVFVKPWPGLILDGIPTHGARIPRALAEEWAANHMVVIPKAPAPVRSKPTVRRQSPRGSGATRPRKQRRA